MLETQYGFVKRHSTFAIAMILAMNILKLM